MANQISADKKRTTYTEWRDTHEILSAYAKSKRLDLSIVIREATLAFAEKLRHPEPQKTPANSPKKSVSKKKTS